MEAVELPAMVVALFLMVGSVVAKVFTAQMISRMKHQIGHVSTSRKAVNHCTIECRLQTARETQANIIENDQSDFHRHAAPFL